VLNAAMLGSLTPVEHIDPKEYSRLLSLNLLANQALIAAFDPLLRKAERADVVALTSSVGERAARLLGRLRLVQGGARNLLGAYADETAHAGRIRVHIVDPGATRTRMRAARLPRRGAGERQAARSGRKAIVERLQSDAPKTGSRVEAPSFFTIVTWATSIPPPRKPPSQYIR
jgi:NAD(P)-dependent dehydrogenase (short-subunit alcohol dehydrogenase family)